MKPFQKEISRGGARKLNFHDQLNIIIFYALHNIVVHPYES